MFIYTYSTDFTHQRKGDYNEKNRNAVRVHLRNDDDRLWYAGLVGSNLSYG